MIPGTMEGEGKDTEQAMMDNPATQFRLPGRARGESLGEAPACQATGCGAKALTSIQRQGQVPPHEPEMEPSSLF